MPWVRWSADAVGKGDSGLLLVRLPIAALAADAASEGENRGGEGRCDVQLPGVRDVVDGRGRPSCLGNVLLSRLPQTGLAQTARGGHRVVRPRIRWLSSCFTAGRAHLAGAWSRLDGAE